MSQRTRKPSDFNAEIEAHIRLETERLQEQGLSKDDARAAARRAFGNVLQAEERFYESHRWRFWDQLAQDLRVGLRTLIKNPGFAFIAILTLALGIAVNASMFSLVSAFLLRRPPGRDPNRIVVVSAVSPDATPLPDARPTSAANYLAWRQASDIFSNMAADDPRPVNLSADGQPEVVAAAAVTPNYFSVFGVAPQFGRTFAAAEDRPGRDHVAILSYRLWQRRFASDPDIVGRTIRVNRENYTVIGVMPANFQLLGFPDRLWTPLVLTAADQNPAARKDRSLYLFARLKPGATTEQARAEMVALAHRAQQAFPEFEKGWGAAVRTLPDFLVYNFSIRSALLVLMTTVGLVLMIACANVAGLLLARASTRRKELALRISLGATRLRIIRQLLTEGVVLALFGGCAGLLLAYWGIDLLRANLNFNEAISAVPLGLDRNVLFFALGVSLLSALLCSLAPALQASRTDINASLKEEGRAASPGRSRTRLRMVLVIGETALALTLLIGTGLLIRGIFLIHHQNLGFRTSHLLTAGITLDSARYQTSTQQALFLRDLLPRLQRIPGTDAVAAASNLPATGASSVTLAIEGQPELPAGQKLSAMHVVVTTGYFVTSGIPILRGRAFTDADDPTRPRIAVVNQEFVRRILKDQNALGRRIRLDVPGAHADWSEIVGVAANVKSYSEEATEDPEIYEPFLQRPLPSFSVMLRTNVDPTTAAPALRAAVSQIDPELPLARVMTMSAVVESQGGGDPVFVKMLGTFAALALILAAIGIYGLIAYSVDQRTHELGIRIALGASRSNLMRMILWEGLKMAAIGAAIGLALSLPLPHLFESIFYGLHLREHWLFVAVPASILFIAVLSTYIPARRALSIEPVTALRHE